VSGGHDGPNEPGRGGRGRLPGKQGANRENAAADHRGGGGPDADRGHGAPHGMERLGDLLPGAAREYGLEDQLD
jgi:hypothetical protein